MSSSKFKLPDSGQKYSYDKTGKVVFDLDKNSNLFGQDGDTVRNKISLSKRDSNDNLLGKSADWNFGLRTVLDENTGLVWEVKSPDKNSCNYYGDKYDFRQAQTEYIEKLNSENYGGHSDWRLPNKDELRSIIDNENTNPAVNTDFFPNCQVASYWCSDEYKLRPVFGWVLFFGLGSATAASKKSEQFVRAVRGGYNSLFGKADSSRFTDNADGTVTDSVTGLIWQQGENDRMNWYEALEFVKNMNLAGHTNWRLPNIKELNTILNLNYDDGWWYFKEFFPADGLEPPLLHYFSSSVHENSYAWVTNFCFGYDGYYANKMATLLFRAVCDAETIVPKIEIKKEEVKIFKLPATGQNDCYNLNGEIITTPQKDDTLYGQDGNYNINPISYEKIISDDIELIKDKNTGLIWELKSSNPNDINFAKDRYSWEDAKRKYIEKLNTNRYGGFDDWRLPNREELRSIVDYSGVSPALSSEIFPNTEPAFYWSKDIFGDSKDMAWGVYFAYGCGICYATHKEYFVRAVRGGYNPKFGDSENYNFIVNSDRTVSDLNTNLMWYQDELEDMSFDVATEFCKKLNFAGHNDWRIPNIKELGTILDVSKKDEYWGHKKIFPNIKTAPLGFYWASSTFGSTFGWGINFLFGYDGYYADKIDGKYPFRPVRDIIQNSESEK